MLSTTALILILILEMCFWVYMLGIKLPKYISEHITFLPKYINKNIYICKNEQILYIEKVNFKDYEILGWIKMY